MARRLQFPHIPGIPEEAAEALRAAFKTAVRKASPWSISIGVLLIILIVGATLFLWMHKDFFLTLQERSLDKKHCEEKVTVLEARVSALELRLKDRTAQN